MKHDYTLISPPMDLKTKDPLVTIASNTNTATIDLRSLQPKLVKRLTAKAKSKQWAECQAYTAEIF